MHKARVSSANLGWIAWLCYPLRKGHPGTQSLQKDCPCKRAIAKTSPWERVPLEKGSLPQAILEKGCPLQKGNCQINPWERMLLAKGNPLQTGIATLALELFGHPSGKGKDTSTDPCKRMEPLQKGKLPKALEKGHPLRKGTPWERASLEKGWLEHILFKACPLRKGKHPLTKGRNCPWERTPLWKGSDGANPWQRICSIFWERVLILGKG